MRCDVQATLYDALGRLVVEIEDVGRDDTCACIGEGLDLSGALAAGGASDDDETACEVKHP